MHGMHCLLPTALCPVPPQSDLSFRTVITVRPAVVSSERYHVSSIEESPSRSLPSCPDILTGKAFELITITSLDSLANAATSIADSIVQI